MPIIRSLLDTDFYKFTMGQWVFKRYPAIPVRYAFKNRTAQVPLADYIDEAELRSELDQVQTLRLQTGELDYLRSLTSNGHRLFNEEYVQFLRSLQLPPYELAQRDGSYQLEFFGAWETTIYWETLALSILNELYYRACLARLSAAAREDVITTGKMRLADKIRVLQTRPDIVFSEFGSRRRFSRSWQEFVTQVLAQALPQQLLGTSNMALASQYHLPPIGTMAHETFMVLAGIMATTEETLRASHNQVLQEWWNEYGWDLSIALTDTYGTEFFFRDMTATQAWAWKGLRQDSGDPVAFGERAIRFYQQYGIDPGDKVIVFSDGLDLPTIVKLADHFAGRIRVSFGWGTNLTNDLGFDALSLVIKVVEADGHRAVKLSDNLAKATGTAGDIARFKLVFGHTATTFETCTY